MAITYRSLIGRALAAGLLVGLVLGAYQLAVVEPVIDDAIALEERLAADEHGHGHDHGDEARFSRGEQVGGGVAGTVIYAVVVSAVFGTVLAATRHQLPGRTDLARSLWLAAVGFGTVALVPALAHPPNPPAVGDPATVGQRTLQWAAILLLGIIIARVLVALSDGLRRHVPDHTRIVAVVAATLVAYGAVLVLFPTTPVEIDASVPAGLVWDFRVRSIGGLALLWAGLGLGVGWFLERDARATRPPAERTAVPA